jgi:hypothetical protein
MTIGHDADIKDDIVHTPRPEYPEALTEHFSPAEIHKGIFNQNVLTDLIYFMWNKTTWWQLSQSGNLFRSGNFDELVNRLERKLKPYIDLEIMSGAEGNFFHTPHGYGLHTDMPERGEWVDHYTPYKSVLIPLYKLPEASECNIAYFTHRIADVGCALVRGDHATTHYDHYTDYYNIKNVYTVDGKKSIIDDEEKFNKEDFNKYGFGSEQTSSKRYGGLTIETATSWEPGDLHVFDTAQIHGSTRGSYVTKGGLRISFMRTLINSEA